MTILPKDLLFIRQKNTIGTSTPLMVHQLLKMRHLKQVTYLEVVPLIEVIYLHYYSLTYFKIDFLLSFQRYYTMITFCYSRYSTRNEVGRVLGLRETSGSRSFQL